MSQVGDPWAPTDASRATTPIPWDIPSRPSSAASHVTGLTGFGPPEGDSTMRQDMSIQNMLTEMRQMYTTLNTRLDTLETGIAGHFQDTYTRLDGIYRYMAAELTQQNMGNTITAIRGYAEATHRDTQALIANISNAPVQPVQPAQPVQPVGIHRPVPAPPTHSNHIKLAKPDKFDGKKEKAVTFKIAVSQYLRGTYPNASDEQKVLFTLSYFEGKAMEWVEPYQEQDIMLGSVTWLHNWDGFWVEFEKRFGEVDRAEKARKKIRGLRQTKTVQDYLRDFQSCATYLRYNDAVLRDMFYDGLHDDVKRAMVAQLFDPQDPTTTFQNVADRALEIDVRLESFNACSNTISKSENKNTSTSAPNRDRLSTGDNVYMIGTDGRAVKGKIESLGKNAQGRTLPNVKWAGQTSTAQVPFVALKKDDRPMNINRPPPPVPALAKGKGPGPMELDAQGRSGGQTCYRCQGKGHIARDCPSKPMSGYEAKVEEVPSDSDEDEPLKGDA